MAGKRGPCAQCGVAFTVPTPTADDLNPRADWPEYIGVECHLCGTRMYGGPDQVGHEFKCPDCGARTVLPPPPKPKPKNIPAALEGEQYELWEPEAQPLPSEMLAHQPKFIAVRCRKCDTLMYATEKQVGETITCPDCGRNHVVPPLAAAKPPPSPMASEAETPVLDSTSAPSERPSAISPELRRRIYEQERDSEYGRALEESRRTGKRMEVDVRGRPIIPRWPLLTGIVPFLFSPDVPARCLAIALGMGGSLAILMTGLDTASSGGMGALAGMCLFAFGSALTMICASVAFSYFLAIVSETSEGAKRIQNWPYIFDWFGDFLVLAVAAMMSALPGWAIAHFITDEPLLKTATIAASMIMCFPLIVLSQLDIGSMWAILSTRVLRSMLRCPFSWLTFYAETTAIIATCIAVTEFAARSGYHPLMVAAPLGAVSLFIYARLLGRLAWRLAEAMPERA
jgi:DNA-directed RNA polymerase subunit RPC12/RpoP